MFLLALSLRSFQRGTVSGTRTKAKYTLLVAHKAKLNANMSVSAGPKTTSVVTLIPVLKIYT